MKFMSAIKPMLAPMLALASVAALAACSPSPSYLLAGPTDAPSNLMDPMTGALPGDALPRAQPPVSGVYGSYSIAESSHGNNRGLAVRSGLNSDPNNPSGAPGHPQSWNSL